MKLISQISDLKAVSGGYIYDEFVTADTIYANSVFSAVCGGIMGGVLGGLGGAYVGAFIGDTAALAGGLALGAIGAAALGKFSFYHNDYSDIEPNTWVRWDVTVTVIYV